jgi:hypothetical protein
MGLRPKIMKSADLSRKSSEIKKSFKLSWNREFQFYLEELIAGERESVTYKKWEIIRMEIIGKFWRKEMIILKFCCSSQLVKKTLFRTSQSKPNLT